MSTEEIPGDKKDPSEEDMDDEEELTGLKAVLNSEEKSLNLLLEKSKERNVTGKWLSKAHKHEKTQDYKKALEAYIKYIEAKLVEMNSDPASNLKTYLGMVGYYLKVAECYEKVTHTSAGGKERDMENAGKYHMIAAGMYEDMEKYDEAFKQYEKSALCYAEVESFRNAAAVYVQAGLMHHKLGKKRMATTCFTKAAEFYEKAEDYANASKAYIKTAELNIEVKDIYGAINSYTKTAECYDKMDRPKLAIQFYIKSAEISSTLERYTEVADNYERAAKSYEKLGDYETAIYYHLHSAELNAGNNDLATSFSFENAARAYDHLENYDDAITYFNRAIDIRVKLKNYQAAASASKEAGDVYEKTGDYKQAANMYFQYAEYDAIANKDTTGEGYKKAAKILETAADKEIGAEDHEAAIEKYMEATKSYDRMGDNQGSAAIYLKMGELEFKRDYDKAIRFYQEAADRYKKAGDHSGAAKCYILAKDYLNAAMNYRKYAEESSKKNDVFHAGEGYLKAASAYRRMKKEKEMLECYSKSVHNFIQFLERAEFIKTNESMNVGTAKKKIGECYLELDDGPKSKKYFQEALSFFEEKGDEREAECTKALLKIVEADLKLKVGDEKGVEEMLSEAINLLNDTIENGNWPSYYQEFLEFNRERINEMKGRLAIKPDIQLIAEQPQEALKKGRITLKVTLKNSSKYDVSSIYFLTNLPQEFTVSDEPESIDQMAPGESRDILINAEMKLPGKFNFAPLEILYRDKEGNKYMKASNSITIEVK